MWSGWLTGCASIGSCAFGLFLGCPARRRVDLNAVVVISVAFGTIVAKALAVTKINAINVAITSETLVGQLSAVRWLLLFGLAGQRGLFGPSFAGLAC